MNGSLRALCMTLAIVAAGSAGAADVSVSGGIDGIQIEAESKSEQRSTKASSSCASQCNAAHARCNSEVRRARQSCSRGAATAGRDSFDGPFASDSSAFCAYFRRPRQCGPGCEARFARQLDRCLSAVNNTAAMRNDCIVQERQAQNVCRDELRDCESACARLSK